jgi:hypothetical protein
MARGIGCIFVSQIPKEEGNSIYYKSRRTSHKKAFWYEYLNLLKKFEIEFYDHYVFEFYD